VNRIVGALLVLGCVIALALTLWRGLPPMDLELMAYRDTVRITDSVLVVRAETVTVRQKAVTRWDSIVRTVTDTQVVVLRDSLPPDTVVVPREVIAKDRAKDSLITALYQHDTTQQWRIATRDKLIRELGKKSRPYSIAATLGYVCHRSCGLGLAVGLSYRIR
jgi:hypothetical protein